MLYSKPTIACRPFFVLMFAFAWTVHAQDTWRPDRNVEIIVPTAPGGGNDKTARTLQKVWQETGFNTNVQNRTGGGGAVAYTYLNQSLAMPTAAVNHFDEPGRSRLRCNGTPGRLGCSPSLPGLQKAAYQKTD